ncbi:UNVERIFIED_CONTAM: protein NRT1/ PTR FAMILY 8.2 [Sesamum angustifolium]|uniref:Protein NRT1/ PTR FAMILY 8.2 n=1 Tax=Sesamum angustifolium TaxID=2727405 RepID=A0AAW2KM19_9LAMI
MLCDKFSNCSLFLALYLVALGSGGMRPCVSSYGADQFDDADEVEKGHKSSFFNWLYFSVNIGVLIGCSIPVLIQEKFSQTLDNWSSSR